MAPPELTVKMAPTGAKRQFTGTGMYQTTVAAEHQVSDDHELKTFRTSAAAPVVGALNVHATPKGKEINIHIKSVVLSFFISTAIFQPSPGLAKVKFSEK